MLFNGKIIYCNTIFSRKFSMEINIEHLKFIQTIITRMNTNSFMIKGWSLTITSAFLALYSSSNNIKFVLVAIIPIVFFWFLDAYYLQQERKFHGIYNDVAQLTTEEERVHVRMFEMPIDKYRNGKYCYCDVMSSRTILPFYLLLIFTLGIAYVYLR